MYKVIFDLYIMFIIYRVSFEKIMSRLFSDERLIFAWIEHRYLKKKLISMFIIFTLEGANPTCNFVNHCCDDMKKSEL